jgi:hypothetical protein
MMAKPAGRRIAQVCEPLHPCNSAFHIYLRLGGKHIAGQRRCQDIADSRSARWHGPAFGSAAFDRDQPKGRRPKTTV